MVASVSAVDNQKKTYWFENSSQIWMTHLFRSQTRRVAGRAAAVRAALTCAVVGSNYGLTLKSFKKCKLHKTVSVCWCQQLLPAAVPTIKPKIRLKLEASSQLQLYCTYQY